MISRERAAWVAVEKLQLHSRAYHNLTVRTVVSNDEVTGRRPVPYIVGNIGLDECWCVYFEQTDRRTLSSSTIMLISRATGEEVYFGSAGDEG